MKPRKLPSGSWNTRRKPFPRSKIHSNRILIPNKKAPQNAK